MNVKITDAFYAAIGAPVLAGRKAMEVGGKAVGTLRETMETSAAEGREVADKFGGTSMVEDLNNRFEVDERVGKLRDQVESVIDRWRDGFEADKKDAKKSTTKKAAAKKPAAKKTTPAKKAAAKKADAAEKAEKVEVTS